MTIAELVEKCDFDRDMVPEWNNLRLHAWEVVQQVYNDRVQSYDVDHPPYEEMIFGPVSFATELFKRVRRMASLLSPIRLEPLRKSDLNRIIDLCVDCMNYFSWLYAMMVLATNLDGNVNSDDAPRYIQQVKGNEIDWDNLQKVGKPDVK